MTPISDQQILHESLSAILSQGATMLEWISDEDYARDVPVAGASIGGHYRHVLEHIEPLVCSVSAVIDYDARRRDPWIEKNREGAVQRTLELSEACGGLQEEALDLPVRVRHKVDYGSMREPSADSTLRREFLFGISHAVHHFAMIAIMARIMEIPVPEGFGLAPATAKHRKTLEKTEVGAK